MEQGPLREMDGFARIGYPESAYHLIDQNGVDLDVEPIPYGPTILTRTGPTAAEKWFSRVPA
jgi:hypothetical protein